jgi:hypothetical protein
MVSFLLMLVAVVVGNVLRLCPHCSRSSVYVTAAAWMGASTSSSTTSSRSVMRVMGHSRMKWGLPFEQVCVWTRKQNASRNSSNITGSHQSTSMKDMDTISRSDVRSTRMSPTSTQSFAGKLVSTLLLVAIIVSTSGIPQPASALDMEAFAAQQLQSSSSSASSSSPSTTSARTTMSTTIIPANVNRNTESNQNDAATMSPDEALCRFGQPSVLKGDACVRAGMSTAARNGGSGVDAYGNVNRGSYAKCTKQYTLTNNVWESEWICQ